jgi:sugar lactone lactonase YvrE
VAACAVAVFLWLWVPSPIDSVALAEPPARGLEGSLAPNEDLRSAQPIAPGRLEGPEDVAVDAAGRLYTGTADGRIVRIAPRPGGSETLETFADTGGRPFGLRFGPNGTLFVADGVKGLLAIDPKGGIRTLATAANGVPFRFTDDLDVAPDGKVYFSDASDRFGVDEYLYDLLEGRPHGRLLVWDPAAKTDGARVLLDGLSFANGVALARDGSFVLVNETYLYRVRRYWLTGARQGTSDIFLDHLPGFPDNLTRDPATGHFWIALFTVRNPAMAFLHPHPFLKDQLAKLPRFLWPKPAPYGLVLEVDESGAIVGAHHDPDGRVVRGVTSAEPHDGKLYLGSLHGGLFVWSMR